MVRCAEVLAGQIDLDFIDVNLGEVDLLMSSEMLTSED